MLSNDIRGFFAQQNFLLLQTNIAGVTVMKNSNGSDEIYTVLLDNDNKQIWSTSLILAINSQLMGQVSYPHKAAVLFIVITDDSSRDKYLAQISGVNVWLADSVERKLLIYENQPDDFYGFRYGLELTVKNARLSNNPFDIKTAMKDKKNFPFVTIALIIVNVIYFIVLASMGDPSDANYMWSMGANYGYSVFKDFQFYRLITCMFMHFSVVHLGGNMIYLAFAGTQAERGVGHLRFFLIYMLSGIAASLFSSAYYLLSDINTVSAGASGAIYGVIGIILYLTAKNRGSIGSKRMMTRIAIVIIFLLYSNIMYSGTQVDAAAHIAGLIFGILLSLAFCGSTKSVKKK